MAKDNKIIWIIGAIVVGFMLFHNSTLFTINLQSNQVQYYNSPIIVKFTHNLTAFTSSTNLPLSNCWYDSTSLGQKIVNMKLYLNGVYSPDDQNCEDVNPNTFDYYNQATSICEHSSDKYAMNVTFTRNSTLARTCTVELGNGTILPAFSSSTTSTTTSNPTIKYYFNENLLGEATLVNGSLVSPGNQTIVLTTNVINGTNVVQIDNVKQAGIFKLVVQSGSTTESQQIEVRQPFVDVKHDIPTTLVKGDSAKLSIQTYTPQGEIMDADSVDVDMYLPDGSKQSLLFDKQTNSSFTKQVTYVNAGEYIFKIHAHKLGYTTNEVSTITNVILKSGPNPILYIWFGAALLFIGLVIFRRFRKR